MTNEPALFEVLKELGNYLEFDVREQVEASESAWVDMVWFDRHLPVGPHHLKMRYAPVLPVVALEVELKTGLNAKHVKGSVSNLNNLGAQLGVIVIGNGNLDALKKQTAHTIETDEEIKQILRDRVYRWIYAEAQPRGRIIMMFEDEVRAWDKKVRAAPGPASSTLFDPPTESPIEPQVPV